MVDLLFADGYGTPDLVFGASGTPPVIIALGSSATLAPAVMAGVLEGDALPIGGASTLPGISSPLAITEVPALSMAATAAAPLVDLGIAYDNAVNRAPFRWADADWQDAGRLSHFNASPHVATSASETGVEVGIGSAIRRSAEVAPVWQPMITALRPSSHLPWGAGTPLGTLFGEGFADLLRHVRPALTMPFEDGTPRAERAASPWRELFRRPRPQLAVPWGAGVQLGARLVVMAGAAGQQVLTLAVPWQGAGTPAHGVSPGIVVPPGPGGLYVPPLGNAVALLFDDAMPASLDLLFGRLHIAAPPVANVVIPVLRAYIVVNDVTLVRTDNFLALAPLSLSVSIDADSWCWGWQASLPATSLGDVLPSAPGAPVEFEATINGVSFLLLAEKVTRDRRFAQARINVTGRGIAAELGDPYAAPESRNNPGAMTAQQVMADSLTSNGVPIGWALDWQLTDWLVPAGAWSHTGSYIEAVSRIAEAAGGYVQASRNSRTLSILHRYPVAPWDWGGVVPAFSLPSAATTRESVEWVEKPPYNAVYVSGEGSGVLARIKRAGTAGDRVAPMITDQLNTHVDVASQRGRLVLSDTGPQQLLQLDTPILAGVGIYPVGSFVQFVDGGDSRMGIVRSLTINAALPTVRQTIEIECHG